MRAGRGPLAAAGGVAGWTLVSRALGFLRWVVQASTVGTGTVAGAYATANQVPNVLYEIVVGGALAATVVPLLSAAIASGRRSEAARTASGLLGLVLVILLPVAVLLGVLAGPISALLPASQGVDPAVQHELVAAFLRMFALQIPLYGIGVVLTGVLQAHGSFMWPALTPVASSLVVMGTYAIFGRMTAGGQPSAQALAVLGWGTTAGVAALSLPLAWPVHRLGLRIRPRLRLEADTARRALRLGGSGLWTLLAQQASVVAVLILARSGGATGTIAVYQYTQAVYLLPYAVLAVPVATVLYPRLAAAFDARSERRSGARDLAARSTALVSAVAVAGAGALTAVSGAAERFFSTMAEVTGMSAALVVMAPGLVGYALIYQVTRVLYAADRARPAALAGSLGWLTVVVASALAVAAAAPAGGNGPATLVALGAGQAIGMSVAGGCLLAVLASSLGRGVLGPILWSLARCAPVALGAGLAARWALAGVDATAPFVAASIVAALGVAVLTIATAVLGDRSLLTGLRSTPAPA